MLFSRWPVGRILPIEKEKSYPAMPMNSREIRLISRPEGEPTLANFEVGSVELPEPSEGEVYVRNLCFSVDPYMRGRMNDRKSYVPPFRLGRALEGAAVGRVELSRDASVPAGSLVLSMLGWRDAFVAPARQLRVLDETLAPPSTFLGLLGVTGLTAWVGLFKIGALQSGETVFISGGAGAVGSAACQLAKVAGARVIASAGSEAKVKWLIEELHVDHAFNYRDGDPLEHLKQGDPEGIHLYLDNTGGPQLEAAISALRDHGRIAMCGAIAGYNNPVPGPRNLHVVIGKRLRIEGFIVSDSMGSLPEFFAALGPDFKAGKLHAHETIVDGLEAAPEAFLSLLKSGDSHTGKLVIRLAD
jgi:NADPH-dependent curcumin reductase CurA